MGTILEFPAIATSRRSVAREATAQDAMGHVVILPVIRIERYDETSGDRGPEEGAASGRRRRRRARS